MLQVRGVEKTYRATERPHRQAVALEAVDLNVPTGTFTSILGPSGSGKTTLLRCIAGFERPDAGTITLSGRVLVSPERFLRPFDRGVGIVPQEGTLFPHLTVAQNIGFGLRGRGQRDRQSRIEKLLEMVGMADLADRRPDQLSGGQQQRVALARALAPEPELVLLDEPFSALDAHLRVELREEVRALLGTLGSTTILVTHDRGEAMSLSDHLIVMQTGRVVAAGDPSTIYDRPDDPNLAGLVGDMLLIDGRTARNGETIDVECALGVLPVCHFHGTEGPCRVLIRPEQVTIDNDSRGVPGRVVARSYYGHDAILQVNVEGLPDVVAVRVPGHRMLQVGEATRVSVTDPVVTYPTSS